MPSSNGLKKIIDRMNNLPEHKDSIYRKDMTDALVKAVNGIKQSKSPKK